MVVPRTCRYSRALDSESAGWRPNLVRRGAASLGECRAESLSLGSDVLQPWPGPMAAAGPGCNWAVDSESAGWHPNLAGRVATSLGVRRAGSVVIGDDVYGPWAGQSFSRLTVAQLGFEIRVGELSSVIWTVGGRMLIRVISTWCWCNPSLTLLRRRPVGGVSSGLT